MRDDFPIQSVSRRNLISMSTYHLFEESVYLVSSTAHFRQHYVTDLLISMPKITIMSPTTLVNRIHLTTTVYTFTLDELNVD